MSKFLMYVFRDNDGYQEGADCAHYSSFEQVESVDAAIAIVGTSTIYGDRVDVVELDHDTMTVVCIGYRPDMVEGWQFSETHDVLTT